MSTQPSAADLIAQAQAATTQEELDAIEAQVAGRVTVQEAVDQRRAELGSGEHPTTTEQPAGEPAYSGGQGEPSAFGEPGEAAPGTDNPGDLDDAMPDKQAYVPEQVDPPLGPYPDPPLGPYPDPVIKEPQPPEEEESVDVGNDPNDPTIPSV